MKKFAVMGNPIAHSLSPQIHRMFQEQIETPYVYDALHVPLGDFSSAVEQFFSQEGACGLNITAPFKKDAFMLAEYKTEAANSARSVNTLFLNQHGELWGHNTDGVGLINDLTYLGCSLKGKRILLLGAGGAAWGILGALLKQCPLHIVVVNRTFERADALASHFSSDGNVFANRWDACQGSFDVVMNALPCDAENTYKKNKAWLHKATFAYDLNYRQHITPFLAWAKQHGVRGVDGYGMLIEQAAESAMFWHGVDISTKKVRNRLLGVFK